jgi:hypothetical protein
MLTLMPGLEYTHKGEIVVLSYHPSCSAAAYPYFLVSGSSKYFSILVMDS